MSWYKPKNDSIHFFKLTFLIELVKPNIIPHSSALWKLNSHWKFKSSSDPNFLNHGKLVWISSAGPGQDISKYIHVYQNISNFTQTYPNISNYLQEDLDLSHNAISHLSLFSSTPSLRSLNLAHNNINDIRSVTTPTRFSTSRRHVMLNTASQ